MHPPTREGYSVQVVEAMEKIGGRSQRRLLHPSDGSEGVWVDEGGQWVGALHFQMQALLREYGIETYLSYHNLGQTGVIWQGQRYINASACLDCGAMPVEDCVGSKPEEIRRYAEAAPIGPIRCLFILIKSSLK